MRSPSLVYALSSPQLRVSLDRARAERYEARQIARAERRARRAGRRRPPAAQPDCLQPVVTIGQAVAPCRP